MCWRVGNIPSVPKSGSVNACPHYRPTTITRLVESF